MTGPCRWPLSTDASTSLSPSCDTWSPAICKRPAGNHFWLQQRHLDTWVLERDLPEISHLSLKLTPAPPLISALWGVHCVYPTGEGDGLSLCLVKALAPGQEGVSGSRVNGAHGTATPSLVGFCTGTSDPQVSCCLGFRSLGSKGAACCDWARPVSCQGAK